MKLFTGPADINMLLGATTSAGFNPNLNATSASQENASPSFASCMSSITDVSLSEDSSLISLSSPNSAATQEDIADQLTPEEVLLSSDFMEDLQLALEMASADLSVASIDELDPFSTDESCSVDDVKILTEKEEELSSEDDEQQDEVEHRLAQPQAVLSVQQQHHQILENPISSLNLTTPAQINSQPMLAEIDTPAEFTASERSVIFANNLLADYQATPISSTNFYELTPYNSAADLNAMFNSMQDMGGVADLSDLKLDLELDLAIVDNNILSASLGEPLNSNISFEMFVSDDINSSSAEELSFKTLQLKPSQDLNIQHNYEAAAFSSDSIPSLEVLAASIEVPIHDKQWHKSMADLIAKQMYPQNIQTASIKLSPEELGPIYIDFKLEDQRANITFTAASGETKKLLEQNFTLIAKQLTDETSLMHANLNFSGNQQSNSASFNHSSKHARASSVDSALTVNGEQVSTLVPGTRHDGKIDIKV